jgi:hypothetical protein
MTRGRLREIFKGTGQADQVVRDEEKKIGASGMSSL